MSDRTIPIIQQVIVQFCNCYFSWQSAYLSILSCDKIIRLCVAI